MINQTNSITTTDSKPDIEVLERAIGDKDLVIFLLEWLKCGQNATKAYMNLHPNVEYNSARVLGSKQLTKVNILDILTCYGLGIETYLLQLKAGLEAMQGGIIKLRDGSEIDTRSPDHKTRRQYHEVLGNLLKMEGKDAGEPPPFDLSGLGAAIEKSRIERGLPY